METKVILCPKCRMPNAAGVANCRGCGIRLCRQCSSAMPPQLGVCPQCGWWDPDWKLPFRDTDKDAPEQKPGRIFTKKLEFQCPQCGAYVAHDAEKCTICGYVGHMQLRDKQNKSSTISNSSAPATRSRSINTKHNSSNTSRPRSAAIQSEIQIKAFPKAKDNRSSYKKSFSHKKGKTTDKAGFWGYETKKSFPLWLLLAIIISAVILVVLSILLILWFHTGN